MGLCLLWLLKFSTEAQVWIKAWYEGEESVYKVEVNELFFNMLPTINKTCFRVKSESETKDH